MWSSGAAFDVFTSCAASSQRDPRQYHRDVVDLAGWTESHQLLGLLIYADNQQADPWWVGQIIIDHSDRLIPLIAVQPVYQHPFMVANRVAWLAATRARRVHLNMVTGGFPGHLGALCDPLADDHDARYARLVEHATVIHALLTSAMPVDFAGRYVALNGATLGVEMPPGLLPSYYVAGSSEASAAAAEVIGAVRLIHPGPPGQHIGEEARHSAGAGVSFGIITRESSEAAWREAHARFPANPMGERIQDMAARRSTSVWYRSLSRRARTSDTDRSPYWLVPLRTYRTFCPYLVGSYEEIAAYLARYHEDGIRTLILDTPDSEEDLDHIGVALDLVARDVARSLGQPIH